MPARQFLQDDGQGRTLFTLEVGRHGSVNLPFLQGLLRKCELFCISLETSWLQTITKALSWRQFDALAQALQFED